MRAASLRNRFFSHCAPLCVRYFAISAIWAAPRRAQSAQLVSRVRGDALPCTRSRQPVGRLDIFITLVAPVAVKVTWRIHHEHHHTIRSPDLTSLASERAQMQGALSPARWQPRRPGWGGLPRPSERSARKPHGRAELNNQSAAETKRHKSTDMPPVKSAPIQLSPVLTYEPLALAPAETALPPAEAARCRLARRLPAPFSPRRWPTLNAHRRPPSSTQTISSLTRRCSRHNSAAGSGRVPLSPARCFYPCPERAHFCPLSAFEIEELKWFCLQESRPTHSSV